MHERVGGAVESDGVGDSLARPGDSWDPLPTERPRPLAPMSRATRFYGRSRINTELLKVSLALIALTAMCLIAQSNVTSLTTIACVTFLAPIERCVGSSPVSTVPLTRFSRIWDRSLPLHQGGLNPSRASDLPPPDGDDPTIRKDMGFARWGFGGVVKWNLFALMLTDPRDLIAAADPVGEAE